MYNLSTRGQSELREVVEESEEGTILSKERTFIMSKMDSLGLIQLVSSYVLDPLLQSRRRNFQPIGHSQLLRETQNVASSRDMPNNWRSV